uniref:PDZ domain-containing protein n=1 Tax=Chromera velia CCMP2878 TaxID=1169474 RepID=A0A0G4GNK5_9ALVE|eukprot:Cvel_4981.t1-p1 / transcript=Cvel_4981.t1 / gene=Cvel_4981 / organism=Chromera_velia_CCMP2878 / gene_product=Uncharacterized serine protease syc0938_d, putative / transcript_product=Uncharacterized serine protease syc0938_d, putative / location=Cvel_scaffold225:66988-73539(+) / protein_length=610 / sequence_SO=supercontig / SO=protein_coding / is_pseudo=false
MSNRCLRCLASLSLLLSAVIGKESGEHSHPSPLSRRPLQPPSLANLSTATETVPPPSSIPSAPAPSDSETGERDKSPEAAPEKKDTDDNGPFRGARSANFIAEAVQKVENSVVKLEVTRKVLDVFSLLEGRREKVVQRALGTGFFFDPSGLILTNSHVVKDAESVSITMKDGSTLKGKVAGCDELSDLAVVRLITKENELAESNRGKQKNGSSLSSLRNKVTGGAKSKSDALLPGIPKQICCARLGDSDNLRVGDWLIAVGNPFNLDSTVTVGIVSNLERPSVGLMSGTRVSFIQTDAAINAGNSGGPVINSDGEVVGLATARMQDAEGIGFLVPVNRAKTVMHRLAAGQHVPHPWVGVELENLNVQRAREINEDPNVPVKVPEVQAPMVFNVKRNGPAVSSLQKYDVVTDVNGIPVKTKHDVQRILTALEIGESVDFTFIRGSETRRVTVKTADFAQKKKGIPVSPLADFRLQRSKDREEGQEGDREEEEGGEEEGDEGEDEDCGGEEEETLPVEEDTRSLSGWSRRGMLGVGVLEEKEGGGPDHNRVPPWWKSGRQGRRGPRAGKLGSQLLQRNEQGLRTETEEKTGMGMKIWRRWEDLISLLWESPS